MSGLISYRLRFPAVVLAEQVGAVLQTLASEPRATRERHHGVVLETVLQRTGVSWWLIGPTQPVRHIAAAAERDLPGMRFEPSQRSDFAISRAVELRVRAPERLLDIDLAEATVTRLLGLVRHLRADETVLVQWMVGPWLLRSPIPPATPRSEPRTIWNLPDWFAPVRDSEQVQSARQKSAHHLFAAVGRVAVGGTVNEPRARVVLAEVVSGYQLLRAPGVGVSRRNLPSWWARRRLLRRTPPSPFDPPARLSALELAGVIGWPVGNPSLPGVRYESATPLRLDERTAIPSAVARSTDRVLGAGGHPQQTARLAVLRPHDGMRHLHVVGPTGVGKSTLLARLILADAAAGRGLVVIDPKGDLVDDVLARFPEERLGDIVVLDPTDPAPAGLNPLSDGPLGVDGIVHVLRTTWHDSWGPRLADILHAGLLTLALDRRGDGHCLAELPLLLGDDAFRRPLVVRASKRDRLGLGTFWPWFDSLSDDARAAALAPVMNKLRGLLLRSELRAVLGQTRPRFDLSQVFTNRRCVLVRLPKGRLGSEGARLLGSLLMAQLWRQIQARSSVAPNRRHPVFVYLDEFQEFLRLNIDLSDALVQARGLGVGLVLGHQHLDQLDRPVRSAVLANAGSRVAFRLDHDDAAVVAKRSGTRMRPEDLSGLRAFEAYASLLTDGETTPYGSIRTLPLDRPLRRSSTLVSQSRQRYGVSAEDTEARLAELVDGPGPSAEVDPRLDSLGGRRTSRDDAGDDV